MVKYVWRRLEGVVTFKEYKQRDEKTIFYLLSYKCYLLIAQIQVKLQQERLAMNKEIMDLSYEWWTKLTPLWKKFSKALGVPFESYYKIQLYGWRANQNRKKREMIGMSEEVYQQIQEKPD